MCGVQRPTYCQGQGQGHGQGHYLVTKRRCSINDEHLIILLRRRQRHLPSVTGSLGHWVTLAVTSSADRPVVMVTSWRPPVRCV